jgi:hypothetical protein
VYTHPSSPIEGQQFSRITPKKLFGDEDVSGKRFKMREREKEKEEKEERRKKDRKTERERNKHLSFER